MGQITSAKVFVRGLAVDAEVGVYAHERGRTQPLVVDVELDIDYAGSARLADTLNYETVRTAAKALAESGHIELVERYAERLAKDLMADPRVRQARVRIEKPMALAPDAEGAGVELVMVRS